MAALKQFQSNDDKANEEFFCNTHSREDSGAYVVRLPFKPGLDLDFPGSLARAKQVLLRLEKKFDINSSFAELYYDFMRDYANQDRMRLDYSGNMQSSSHCFFFPHHGVFKTNCPTPKIRIVFNGSAKSNNYILLNDVLYFEENLLRGSSDILFSWMKYMFVFVSDIKDMFRCIKVHLNNQKYQCILWRFNPQEPIFVCYCRLLPTIW